MNWTNHANIGSVLLRGGDDLRKANTRPLVGLKTITATRWATSAAQFQPVVKVIMTFPVLRYFWEKVGLCISVWILLVFCILYLCILLSPIKLSLIKGSSEIP